MIPGEAEPDDGTIIIPKGYRIGHVAQHLRLYQADGSGRGCLGLLPDRMYDHYTVEAILSGLGFSESDMQLPLRIFPADFSGKLNLAKVLVSHPNLLLLNEPTNYLVVSPDG